jgi:hypothetical protein
MRPAFSSPRQAAAFALLLLALLLAPALAQKILPSREAIYSSIWWASGDFPYMDGQIFQEKGDVDIVFMGSSHIWAAFDTPYVQEQLSKELGRPSVARTFGWPGPVTIPSISWLKTFSYTAMCGCWSSKMTSTPPASRIRSCRIYIGMAKTRECSTACPRR